MGTGWRRAFCHTIPRDSESRFSDNPQSRSRSRSPSPSPSPRSCVRLRFLSGSSSNPSTPRLQSNHQPVSSPSLRCRTTEEASTPKTTPSPTAQCETTIPKSAKSQKPLRTTSNPSSPRSPLKLSLFKNSFKFRSSCGICLNSVKTGQGTAIYTAECAHAFHFSCIADHIRKHNRLICPVCNTTWKDVPLLSVHKSQNGGAAEIQGKPPPKVEDKKVIEYSSPRAVTTVNEKQIKPPEYSRSYDDDEPLLSPTAGGRFVPILEADENGDDEEDHHEVEKEFQRFCVNPVDQQIHGREYPRTNVQVRLLPESALISAGHSYETYAVALRVKAPPPAPLLEPSRRAPIDLVTVLDISASMTGPKLLMLKRAMRLVISSLGSSDRLSIVAFSASPKRLLPLRRMTVQGQRSARRIVDRLVCGQGSSVEEALKKATKVLEDRRDRNPIASIMLLSDGQDERAPKNGKVHRQTAQHKYSTRFAHIEIPINSFGFGENGAHSQEHGEESFVKCVGGLLSVVVQDLRVQLGVGPGSGPVEISAIYSCHGRPTLCSSGSVRIGDLYADEERELLVELRVSTSAVTGSRHMLMSVQCLYKDPASQEVVYGREQALLVPHFQAIRSAGIKIERLRNFFITTRAIAESRRLIEHDDYTSAHHLLTSARALLVQASSAAGDEYVRGLEGELAELHWWRQEQQQQMFAIQRKELLGLVDENGDPLTPTSAWRAAEKLAKIALLKKSLNSRVSDLHGFENARF